MDVVKRVLGPAAVAPAPGLGGALRYYPPGLEQSAHAHDDDHVSIVLAGGFHETLSQRETARRAGETLRREAGFRHEVSFSQHGALILTLRGAAAASHEAARPHATAHLSEAPPWLKQAYAQLQSAPATTAIETLARASGVHRVTLARAFRTYYGARPSRLRRDAMVAHALALALAEGESLASCAQAAGFADQAHLTRSIKAACGLPPARLRALLS